jgi:hypothetical protein
MRVFLNDRELAGLDARLQRRLSGRPSGRVVEGAAISAQESVRLRRRELVLLVAVALAAVVLTLGATLALVAVRRPEVLGLLVLAFAAAAILTAGFSSLVVGVMVRAHARRVERRAPAFSLVPGSAVRVEAAGVDVAGRTWPWTSLRIDELGVRQRQGNDAQITFVERLVISDGQRSVNLDALFLSNGRAVLEQIWRRAQAARGTAA